MHSKNNIEIYEHTKKICRELNFPPEPSVKYDYGSPHFSDYFIFDQIPSPNYVPLIIVENIDSFDMARKIITHETKNSDTIIPDSNTTDNKKILVLNLASFMRSGGGVERGCKAQEEDLYRKSNYFQANNHNFYPLRKSQVVYSPTVHIIKDSDYNLLDKPVTVSCLAVAALKNPPLFKMTGMRQHYKNDIDRNIMQAKIDMIFKVAILHKHTDLVLGALGCGVYNNPRVEVALMFKKSIQKYGKYFRRIGFAILSSGDSSNSNFNIFKKILSTI